MIRVFSQLIFSEERKSSLKFIASTFGPQPFSSTEHKILLPLPPPAYSHFQTWFKNYYGSSTVVLLPHPPRAPPTGCNTSPSLPCWVQGVLRAGDLHSYTLPTLLPSSSLLSLSLLPSLPVAAAPPGPSPSALGAAPVAGARPSSSSGDQQ